MTVIECIGADGKLHCCEPHKDVTLCGMKVKSKNIGRDDWKRFWCCECDYVAGEEE